MHRPTPTEDVIANMDLTGCPAGKVLAPLEPPDEVAGRYFKDWETPLAPWGGFKLPSGLGVVHENGRSVLTFNEGRDGRLQERAIVTKRIDIRNGRIIASVKPVDTDGGPHVDEMSTSEALVGIVFRVETSRWYYQFGISGRHRVVLLRRRDDEWFVLAEEEVDLPDGYLDLEVVLDEDHVQCRCSQVGVRFSVTDTMYKRGRIGIRALGQARCAAVRMYQTRAQAHQDEQSAAHQQRIRHDAGRHIPDAVLIRTFNHAELGGSPQFMDFAAPGRYDMLIAGPTLHAATVEGETLWTLDRRVHRITYSKWHGEHGRLIYGFTGERTSKQAASVTGHAGADVVYDEICVIRGSDGVMVARAPVPPMHETARRPDFTPTSGNLTGEGSDIVVREWRDDKQGGGINLWAYDANLNLLWHQVQEGAWYGHHWAVQFYDVDGDGRDELLAGGKMYDADGQLLWVHDRDEEMLSINGAEHYDAVAIGHLSEDPELDPVAFLISGSAGVYVVDALTGRTRVRHPMGHAQGCLVGKVRGDIPGKQILTATRWGNMGILSLFSARGERLWTIQPDFVGQGAAPVTWGEVDPQLIWTNTSAQAQALYNGNGERIKELPELQQLWGNRMRREVDSQTLKMGHDATTYLCLTIAGIAHVFGPED